MQHFLQEGSDGSGEGGDGGKKSHVMASGVVGFSNGGAFDNPLLLDEDEYIAVDNKAAHKTTFAVSMSYV